MQTFNIRLEDRLEDLVSIGTSLRAAAQEG